MERARGVSKAMLSYLKRARENKEFLLKETHEFERGKRHLANIMGIDSGSMTQQDIDNAIKYLFPSGLFEPRARPVMKHPDILFQARKEAQFDIEGRPNHFLFYTVLPNYHEDLSNLRKIIFELNKYEDEQLCKGVLNAPEEARYEDAGRTWLNHTEMCDKFLEPITETDYQFIIKCLEKLKEHPYSSRAKEFIESHSKMLPGQSLMVDLPELKKDPQTGQIYTEITQRRRGHLTYVKTILNGSGKIEINGQNDILFFSAPHMRRAILFPLAISNMIDRVDIIARALEEPVKFGYSIFALSMRYAVSTSIAAFKEPEVRERMRLAGLLTWDPRERERKKYGQEGARRKYTWKKR